MTKKDENPTEEAVELYPSPAESMLFIKTHTSFKGGLMRIISLSGEEFVSGRVEHDEIDVTLLPPGFYVLRLSKDRRVATKKFTKK